MPRATAASLVELAREKGQRSWRATTTPPTDHVREAVAEWRRRRRIPDVTLEAARASHEAGHQGDDGRARTSSAAARIPATSPPRSWRAQGSPRYPVVRLRSGEPADGGVRAAEARPGARPFRCDPHGDAGAGARPPALPIGARSRSAGAPISSASRLTATAPIVRTVWRRGHPGRHERGRAAVRLRRRTERRGQGHAHRRRAPALATDAVLPLRPPAGDAAESAPSRTTTR